MRRVHAAPLARDVSAIGFGCASLGSRVSPLRGKAAIAAALDGGIDWFDVAPAYGDGQAEALLGQALIGRRSDIVLCTKVGIRPPVLAPWRRLLRPALRGALRLAPGARRLVAAHRPSSHRQPITAALIDASIVQSLAALRTDHVDVLLLHDPSLAEVTDGSVIAALETVLRRGQARAVGVAGTLEVGHAAVDVSPVYRVVQCANPGSPQSRAMVAGLAARGVFTVTHGVFGVGGARDDEAAERRLQEALTTNHRGVVLVSSFRSGHLASNVAVASRIAERNTDEAAA